MNREPGAVNASDGWIVGAIGGKVALDSTDRCPSVEALVQRAWESETEMASTAVSAPQPGSDLQSSGGLLVLAAHEGRVERDLLERWVAARGTPAAAIFYNRPRDAPVAPGLVAALGRNEALDDETLVAPVRVAWLPPQRKGRRTARWRDLVRLSDPRQPNERTKRRLLAAAPDRAVVVEAEPARLGDLRRRFEAQHGAAIGENNAFPRFVARQAELALERAEYRIQGARYKVPRVAREDIVASPSFRRGVARLAAELGRDEGDIRAEAATYLHELRTAHDPFVLDLVARLFRWMYRRSYGEVDVVPAEIERLRGIFAQHPVLILPSHKTNLDSPVVESVLARNGLPAPTLFAGINMSFWPMGSLMRRAGRVFLRRKISDNPVYRFALREQLGYLIEKRFNLEWYPEGTRSRTGKLLPPKVGLLSYAADAYRQGHVDDLILLPVSIIYDQAQEVADYARESLGAEKKAENLGWAIKGLREMGQPRGKVYLRIGEPVSMRAALGPPDPDADGDTPEARLALQKLALSVAWQTNRVTPITGIAIVTFALLAAGQRAVTLERIMDYTRLVVDHARERGQPLTASAQLDTPAQVEEVLGELLRTGVVRLYDGGADPVWSIAEGQHLQAAYYRNSMLHFVLDRAIGELAVIFAAQGPAGGRETTFRDVALRLRDALKFEFFFRERPAFEAELDAEMTRIAPDWRQRLDGEGDAVAVHRSIFATGIAHAVLRPFIEAYHVVAKVLQAEPADAAFDERAFLDKCQRTGRQLLLQRELRNPESVSRPLFQTGVQHVRNLKLLSPGPDLAERRALYAMRSRETLVRLDLAEDSAVRG